VIAYLCTESSILFIMASGKTLTVEGFFYPECSFLEVNGEHILTLTE
jgi:hypothetical protein